MIGATSPRTRTVNEPPPLESASRTRINALRPSASETASGGNAVRTGMHDDWSVMPLVRRVAMVDAARETAQSKSSES